MKIKYYILGFVVIIILILIIIFIYYKYYCPHILINGKKIYIEIVDTPEKREKGLMFRKKLGSNKGMLFVHDEPDYYGIWMKNTLIHLDIIWIDKNYKVVDFWEEAKPCEPHSCETKFPLSPAKYILEINNGMINKYNISKGDIVHFINIY